MYYPRPFACIESLPLAVGEDSASPYVLAFSLRMAVWGETFFDHALGEWVFGDCMLNGEVSHWMPLPPAPDEAISYELENDD